jgi:hypothetical protein
LAVASPHTHACVKPLSTMSPERTTPRGVCTTPPPSEAGHEALFASAFSSATAWMFRERDVVTVPFLVSTSCPKCTSLMPNQVRARAAGGSRKKILGTHIVRKYSHQHSTSSRQMRRRRRLGQPLLPRNRRRCSRRAPRRRRSAAAPRRPATPRQPPPRNPVQCHGGAAQDERKGSTKARANSFFDACLALQLDD